MPDSTDLESLLRRSVALQAIALVIGRRQNDQILLLDRAGFQPKEIAALIGTTANSVRVALTHIRKRGTTKLPSLSEE